MAERVWEQEYEKLLKQALDRGDIDRNEYSHKRFHPRFSLKASIIEVTVKQRFTGIDVSIGGISFYAHFPIQPGIVVQVGNLGRKIVEAEVTQCAYIEPGPGTAELRYRINCKFSNEHEGMKTLVLIRETENLDLALI